MVVRNPLNGKAGRGVTVPSWRRVPLFANMAAPGIA